MNPHLKNNAKFSKSQSLGMTALAYLLAYLAAVMAFRQFDYLGDIYGILLADVIATLVIFFLGLMVHNASLYDPYWSVIPIGLAIYWWSLSEYDVTELRKLLLLIVLLYWAIRLTLNWIRGWPGFMHEDWRYVMLRKKSKNLYPLVNLGGIHLLPTLLVFLAMIPAYYVLSSTGNINPLMDWLAFAIGMIAVTIEFVADEQIKKWVASNDNPRNIMKKGLWKYSRHPNYFGEVAFWLSMFLFAYSASPDYLWTVVGFVGMVILFLFGSIPMMDDRSKEKRDGWEEHVKKTSGFLILPPKK